MARYELYDLWSVVVMVGAALYFERRWRSERRQPWDRRLEASRSWVSAPPSSTSSESRSPWQRQDSPLSAEPPRDCPPPARPPTLPAPPRSWRRVLRSRIVPASSCCCGRPDVSTGPRSVRHAIHTKTRQRESPIAILPSPRSRSRNRGSNLWVGSYISAHLPALSNR